MTKRNVSRLRPLPPILLSLVLLCSQLCGTVAFTSEPFSNSALFGRTTVSADTTPQSSSFFSSLRSLAMSSSSSTPPSLSRDSKLAFLKQKLLQHVREFKDLQARDGHQSIDFGVKGGELNSDTRAPQTVDFYAMSKDLGDKAMQIFEVCDHLAEVTPITEPTKYIGDKKHGSKAPLNGTWKLLFTNAADASFSKNSTRGDAKVQNVVDGTKGKITNQITFSTKDDGTEPTLKQLNVIIRAIVASSNRVQLQFRYAKAVFTRFLFLKFRWSLYIPVPAQFISRCKLLFSKLVPGRSAKNKQVPKGYFDILYLDDNLRIQKTGQNNTFVQCKDTWAEARPLL